jgi:glucan biosynthesis protein C
MALPPAAVGSRSHVHYLDWLRVLAMLGIFLFHDARFYDVFGDWHIKNATTSVFASIPIAFMNEWLMPLFFLIWCQYILCSEIGGPGST